MTRHDVFFCAVALTSMLTFAGCRTTPQPVAKYGSNAAVGQTFTHDGVKLYYEVYGAGEPLLVVHGNGLSIASLKRTDRLLPQALQGDRHG